MGGRGTWSLGEEAEGDLLSWLAWKEATGEVEFGGAEIGGEGIIVYFEDVVEW
jgi:hypothetical protein